MNSQHPKPTKPKSKSNKQARELSALTRALSHCCLDKEERICKSFGLHAAGGRVLATVLREGSITPSEVADRLGIGNSRVTPIIDGLLRKGLVIRTEGVDDRRTRRVSLTERGREIAISLQDFETDLHQRLLGHFPVARRKELLESLRELREAMDEIRQSILK